MAWCGEIAGCARSFRVEPRMTIALTLSSAGRSGLHLGGKRCEGQSHSKEHIDREKVDRGVTLQMQ